MDKDCCNYLEVAVAAPLATTLTYSASSETAAGLTPGMRLLVPLGNRLVTGYFFGVTEKPEEDYKIRSIRDSLDTEPLFPEEMIPLYRWVAEYYQYPIGEVIKGALPGGLTAGSGRRIRLTEEGVLHIPVAGEFQDRPQPSWVEDLLGKGTLSPAATRNLWRKGDRKILEKWESRGWVTISQEVMGPSTREKKEICITLAEGHPGPESTEKLKKSEAKTLEIVVRLSDGRQRSVPRREITREYSGAAKALKSLAQHDLVSFAEETVYRDPFGERPPYFPEPERLTEEQQAALDQIIPAVRKETYTPFLLHGITGSGKTEVYLRAAAETRAQGRTVLVLVPEIALATQLEAHFCSRFGDTVALLHSGLSVGERFDQWLRVMRGEAKIVIGARSAVFAPLGNPGLIVVDEEHDGAYKQEDGLRYQGRDLAVLRASLQGATVILGSATPSVTSYFHAVHGKYRLVNLTKRIMERPLPKVEVVDLKKIQTVSGRPPLFSSELVRSLKENLNNQEQSLVFLNRRGFSNLFLCRQCGQTVQCRHCNITLTLHKGRRELVCHYCGFTAKEKTVCANCRSSELVGVGFGTERIENELQGLFPTARIARLDRDTTTNRRDYLKILKAVHNLEIDILVGTQMITKGHHFPHVTLVGIVWADAGLGIPDFRSGERTFQLLSQVTGRAGRGEKTGRVIVQTHQPEHYSITTAKTHDFEALYEKEIGLRQSLKFPPFSRLINLRMTGEREEDVREFAIRLASVARGRAKKEGAVSILGPAAAPLSRLRGKYRWQCLLMGKSVESLHAFCRALLQGHSVSGKTDRVKLIVDVDPENML